MPTTAQQKTCNTVHNYKPFPTQWHQNFRTLWHNGVLVCINQPWLSTSLHHSYKLHTQFFVELHVHMEQQAKKRFLYMHAHLQCLQWNSLISAHCKKTMLTAVTAVSYLLILFSNTTDAQYSCPDSWYQYNNVWLRIYIASVSTNLLNLIHVLCI